MRTITIELFASAPCLKRDESKTIDKLVEAIEAAGFSVCVEDVSYENKSEQAAREEDRKALAMLIQSTK